jgi:hypothetical protein
VKEKRRENINEIWRIKFLPLQELRKKGCMTKKRLRWGKK